MNAPSYQLLITVSIVLLYLGFSYTLFLILTKNISVWKALILIVILSIGIKGLLSTEADLNDWDEKYHALVAKNLTKDWSHPKLYPIDNIQLDKYNWTNCHTWLHKPPLSLWCISLSYKIFGYNSIAVRIPSIFISILLILATFLLYLEIYNDKLGALISASLVSIHGLFLEMVAGRATTDHVDVFFITFSSVAIYCLYSKQINNLLRWIIAPASISFALYSKGMIGFAAPIIFISYLILDTNSNKIKEILRVISFSAIAFIFYNFWINHTNIHYSDIVQNESTLLFDHFFKAIEKHAGGLEYYFIHMRIIFGELIYAVIFYCFYLLFRAKNKDNIVALIWIIGPLILFSISQTKMQSYIMISLPAYAMISAYVISNFWKKQNRWYKLVGLIILATWFRYSIERAKPFKSENRLIGLEQQIKKSVLNINQPAILFQSSHPIQFMVYTDVVCFPFKPSTSDLCQYKDEKYSLYEQVGSGGKFIFEEIDLSEVECR